MSEELAFDLTLSPGHLLHRAQQFASDRFSDATGGVTITQRQFAVLSAVAAQEGLTQTQLVQATGIDRSTLAELVTRMASKGLLLRERAPGDARANAVRLTDQGRELLANARAGAMAADEAILNALPKNKRANFVEALTRIARALELDETELKAEAKKAKAAIKAAAQDDEDEDASDKDAEGKKKKDKKKKKKKG